MDGDSKMDKEAYAHCAKGVVFGLLIALIILLVWMYTRGENFADYSYMDPAAKAILEMKNSADPTSAAAMRKMYGM